MRYLLSFFLITILLAGCVKGDENPHTDSDPRTFHYLCENVYEIVISESCIYPFGESDLLCGTLSKTNCPASDDDYPGCEANIIKFDQYVVKCVEQLRRNNSRYPFTISENYSCDFNDPQPLATKQEVIDEVKKIDACAWIFDAANQD